MQIVSENQGVDAMSILFHYFKHGQPTFIQDDITESRSKKFHIILNRELVKVSRSKLPVFR